MLFSYNWLQSFFDKKLPDPKILADLLTRRAFEVEEVKKISNDTILNVAILPNRAADCFSHIGLARECAAILDLKLKAAVKKITKTKSKAPSIRLYLKIKVFDKKLCPRYCAKMIDGVKVGQSPKWITQRLTACGLRPINNVVDAVNYVMLEMGQPLHTFDYEKIAANSNAKSTPKTITVRAAKNNEIIAALDDKTYKLDQSMLVIADTTGPLAIAGIKGGKRAQITDTTETIIIEAANFSRQTIRQTSRKLGLRTDASAFYEHGLDPNAAQIAIERAAGLIKEIAGGRVFSGMIDFYPDKIQPKWITFDLMQTEKLLGSVIQQARAKKILETLGCRVRKSKGSAIEVLPPSNRLDISLPQDLAEEIGRINGYENIPAFLPQCQLVIPQNNYSSWCDNVCRLTLKEAGFWEVYNYSFIKKGDIEFFGLKTEDVLKIVNPLNIDFEYLRPTLLVNLIKKLINEDNADFFEIGKIFNKNGRRERKQIAAVSERNFFQLKGALELLLKQLGIGQIKFIPFGGNHPIYDSKNSAKIFATQKQIGAIGKIINKITNQNDNQKPLTAFELDIDILSELASQKTVYQPISMYPPIIRDLAILAPRTTLAGDIIDEILKVGGRLIVSIEPIDIYEGSNIPAGLKNIAFRLKYQASSRTLNGKEIDQLQNKIIAAIEARNWQVRK